jgi:hypothetical protein
LISQKKYPSGLFDLEHQILFRMARSPRNPLTVFAQLGYQSLSTGWNIFWLTDKVFFFPSAIFPNPQFNWLRHTVKMAMIEFKKGE